MLKLAFAILLNLFITYAAFAQRDTNVYYLKRSGKVVATKQEADYYLAIFPADKKGNKHLFPVIGYYIDGDKLFCTTSLTYSLPLKLQGSYTAFSVNGIKTAVLYYDHGQITGDRLRYYPNGRFYYKKTYGKTMDNTDLHFIDCSDSTGKVLAVNGNGNWITFNDDFSRVVEKGKIVNGLKDSIWQMYPSIDYKYSELYKNGKIIEDSLTTKIFTSVNRAPRFPGGIDAFGNFLADNMLYPSTARENNIQGRIVISFIVERDGSLSALKVVVGIGYGCDEEALRVISLSPKWLPGMQNGKRVRVAYSVPINFTLVKANY